MNNKLHELITLAKHIPEKHIGKAIKALQEIKSQIYDETPNPNCRHCGSELIVKNGLKDGKQRFLCKVCGKTYGKTTGTVMYHSHSSETTWKQVIEDTVKGIFIDETAESLNLTHYTVFNMLHKILLSLETDELRHPNILSGVCEADETYILESYKGTKFDENFWRKPRKHGATAQKPGISSEYICICTATSRDGGAIAESVNRAKPTSKDINYVFGKKLAPCTLVICDGAKSYDVLEKSGVCSVLHLPIGEDVKGSFYNINTTNRFHSFIKERYRSARGFATNYLNRYNVLFCNTFKSDKFLVNDIFSKLMDGNFRFNSISDIKTLRLLSL